MLKEIQTFGYEGLSIDRFIAKLVDSSTKIIVDVRAMPLSRKPGFSKKALALHLENAGIHYIHMPALGCPKPVRERYKSDGSWPKYTKSFLAYLAHQSEAVEQVAGFASKSKTCLICFEADFNFCHRSFVASAVAESYGFSVRHLKDQMPAVVQRVAA